MKKTVFGTFGIPVLVLSGIVGLGASASAQISAKDVLERVKQRLGDKPMKGIVEMVGYNGKSQPRVWKLTYFDPTNDYKLRTLRLRPDGIADDGPNYDFYPGKAPAGFVDPGNWKIDSRKAIEIVDAEAKKAKMGFESVDYVLRARELSEDPIWILRLRDKRDAVVGTVFLSGRTGRVLRKVWLYRDVRTQSGEPKVVDTAISKLAKRLRTAELKMQEKEYKALAEKARKQRIALEASKKIETKLEISGSGELR